MVGDKIRTMLESEIKASNEFSRQNFGLAVGDDFREVVEETLRSKEVSAHLLCGLLVSNLSSKGVGESLANSPRGPEGSESISKAILQNFEAFKPQMEFLYWGIQIGRKLALQEVETLNGLEEQG